MKKSVKKTVAKKKTAAKRKPARKDFSQTALSAVEKIIGGRLADGVPKKRK